MKSFIQSITIRSLFSAASARRGIHEVIQFGWDMKNVRKKANMIKFIINNFE